MLPATKEHAQAFSLKDDTGLGYFLTSMLGLAKAYADQLPTRWAEVVVLVQALHHVSAHGEQVCACLAALGVEPPDLQPWARADATGRSRWLLPEQ
jgi:hypothetical protein